MYVLSELLNRRPNAKILEVILENYELEKSIKDFGNNEK